jgi:hypothetical protein
MAGADCVVGVEVEGNMVVGALNSGAKAAVVGAGAAIDG